MFGTASFVITHMNQTLKKQDQSIDLSYRKPMDGDQILEGVKKTGIASINSTFLAFIEGVRYAEEYHGISPAVVSSKMERPFIRLTDKEIQELLGPFAGDPISGYTRKLFNQIQDKLEEKNNGH